MPQINFEYSDHEVEYLKSRDTILGAAIDKIGKIWRPINPDPFTALISSIVSQQISKKAAATVWTRLSNAVDITPEAIARTEPKSIQACGMSHRKAEYRSEERRVGKEGR